MEKADIGLIGLAVMGQNLVLNMDDHGFRVAVFNRTVATVDQFVSASARGTRVVATHSLEELVGSALARVERYAGEERLVARVDPGLPLADPASKGNDGAAQPLLL